MLYKIGPWCLINVPALKIVHADGVQEQQQAEGTACLPHDPAHDLRVHGLLVPIHYHLLLQDDRIWGYSDHISTSAPLCQELHMLEPDHLRRPERTGERNYWYRYHQIFRYKTRHFQPEMLWLEVTRSPWRVQVNQLTKICWCLIASPSTPDFLGEVGLNHALGLVTPCCSVQAAFWRHACC